MAAVVGQRALPHRTPQVMSKLPASGLTSPLLTGADFDLPSGTVGRPS